MWAPALNFERCHTQNTACINTQTLRNTFLILPYNLRHKCNPAVLAIRHGDDEHLGIRHIILVIYAPPINILESQPCVYLL